MSWARPGCPPLGLRAARVAKVPPVLPARTTWADAGSMPGQRSTSQARGQAGEKVGSCLQDALSHGSERPQAPAFLTSKTLVLFESPQPAAGAARRHPGAPWRSGHRPVTHQLVLAWLGRKQTRGGRQCGSPTCRMGGRGDRVRSLRRLWDKTCDPTTFLWVESEMLVPGTYGAWPDTYGREALRNTPGCHKGSTPVSLWWARARAQWMEPTRPGRFSPACVCRRWSHCWREDREDFPARVSPWLELLLREQAGWVPASPQS